MKQEEVILSLSRALFPTLFLSLYLFQTLLILINIGPLAGPVVAAACTIEEGILIPGITDSKLIKEEMRDNAYEHLISNPGVSYHIVRIEHNEIDEINILQSSLKAMKLAVEGLLLKLNKKSTNNSSTVIRSNVENQCIALIDGNKIPTNMPIPTVSIVKGDSLIYSIAAASILAKVTRDNIMKEYDVLYPEYNLLENKGYPTFQHRTILSTYGPSPIHRLTYQPVYDARNISNKYNILISDSIHEKMNKRNEPKVSGKKKKIREENDDDNNHDNNNEGNDGNENKEKRKNKRTKLKK